MIGLDGTSVRFASVEPLESSCPECDAEKWTRMFCPTHREGKDCNWRAGREWRVLNGRWVMCKDPLCGGGKP